MLPDRRTKGYQISICIMTPCGPMLTATFSHRPRKLEWLQVGCQSPPFPVRAPPSTGYARSLPYSCRYTNFYVHGVDILVLPATIAVIVSGSAMMVCSSNSAQPSASPTNRRISQSVSQSLCLGFGRLDLKMRPHEVERQEVESRM